MAVCSYKRERERESDVGGTAKRTNRARRRACPLALGRKRRELSTHKHTHLYRRGEEKRRERRCLTVHNVLMNVLIPPEMLAKQVERSEKAGPGVWSRRDIARIESISGPLVG